MPELQVAKTKLNSLKHERRDTEIDLASKIKEIRQQTEGWTRRSVREINTGYILDLADDAYTMQRELKELDRDIMDIQGQLGLN